MLHQGCVMDKSISNLNTIVASVFLGFTVGIIAVTQANAGVIADTPLISYPGGGYNFLIIYGNDWSMDKELSGSETKKSSAVRDVVSGMFKLGSNLDSSSVLYKAVNAQHSIGMGLMTYGGTSDTSPYVWPYSATPYTTYASDITSYCKTVKNNKTTADWGDLFYLNADPNAHPYCLPASVPRPTGFASGNGCTKEGGKTGLFCYTKDGRQFASSPALGKLVIPIEAKSLADLSAQGDTFKDRIDNADSSGLNAIEGAMLTACDYFNTLWFDKNGGLRSGCTRGYPSTQTFTHQKFSDGKQGYTDNLPKIPNSCGSAIVYITDNFQNVTADGQSYTPDLGATQTIPNASGEDAFSFNNTKTDPALMATMSLNSANRSEHINSFFLGLGMTPNATVCKKAATANLNLLACAGYSNSAKAYYPASKDSLLTNLNAVIAQKIFTPVSAYYQYALTPLELNKDTNSADTIIFKPEFTFSNNGGFGWYGDIKAYRRGFTGGKTVWTQLWSAAESMNYNYNANFSWSNRNVYTYNPTTNSGVDFIWNNLTKNQQTLLGGDSNIVDWLKGSPNTEVGSNAYRSRLGYILGDIVNSDMVYVKNEDYSNDILPEGSNSGINPYKSYLAKKANHIPMLYVGTNDGFLHGFKVGDFSGTKYDSSAISKSSEIFAYIPDSVIASTNQASGDSLSRLTDYAMSASSRNGTYYPHVYLVDGEVEVGDAYINNDWKTVLVGTTGAGAKGIFALDITCPVASSAAGCDTGMSKSNVMWEVSDTDKAASSPSSTDSSKIHGDLGYTYAKPSIARLNSGQWSAIVGNGYNSTNGHAVLFIFDLKDGSLIAKIDTGIGSTGDKNGLSSTTLVDIDSDRTVDYVYAGDLYGNVWKFDLRCPSTGACTPSSAWRTPAKPAFIACQTEGVSCSSVNRQPITKAVIVDTANGTGQSSGLMVYLATGKFYELGDNVVPATNPPVQSMYGFWDNGSGDTVTRGNLVGRPVIAGVDDKHRTSDATNALVYGTNKGWFIDLKDPDGTARGEREFQKLVLHDGVLYEETIAPYSQSSCSSGGGGFNWQIDPITGGGAAFGSITGVAYTAPVFFDASHTNGGGTPPGSSVTINTNGEIITPPDAAPSKISTKKGRSSWNQLQ